ncbi:Pachytene checkpoint protein 2-like [Vitis vinifera]|uniref:Pachytene checkpoint protein 2 homolog n=1 Tax=Vitis vinifera TaxID=29760 RepID=A0A438EZ13_VITVI|nr:Pachytene checkpoint protein 2-like [Vitis vinifera]
MSEPMEISLQNATVGDSSDQNGVSESVPSPILTQEKVLVSVEVCLKASSTARSDDVRSAVERVLVICIWFDGYFDNAELHLCCYFIVDQFGMLENRSLSYTDGSVPVSLDDPFLVENVQRICICETDEWVEKHDVLLFWQVKPVVHVFQLSEEGPCEESSGDGQLSIFNEWILPAKEFDGLWESLIYEPGLKQRLLRYAASALLFTEKGVNPFLVSWNR